MKHSNPTQEHIILKHLKRHKSITPLEALRLCGCFRLSARIFQLREAGFDIQTERMVIKNKTFAKYILCN